jgi:hypothetical protein
MKIEQFEKILNESEYDTKIVKIPAKIELGTKEEERVYIEVTNKYSIYFTAFEKIFVMKVFIKRPKDAPKSKQTEEENKQCIEAKFKLLNVLRADGIEHIEHYDSVETTFMQPKSAKKKIDL